MASIFLEKKNNDLHGNGSPGPDVRTTTVGGKSIARCDFAANLSVNESPRKFEQETTLKILFFDFKLF
jgi:hypothetical protein